MPKFLSLPRRNTDSGRLVGRDNKLPICLHVTLLFPSRNYCRQSGPWKCPRSVPEATSDLETSKKPHQRREHLLHVSLHVPFTDLHGLQVFYTYVSTFTFPFTYPSRTFTDCRFSSFSFRLHKLLHVSLHVPFTDLHGLRHFEKHMFEGSDDCFRSGLNIFGKTSCFYKQRVF